MLVTGMPRLINHPAACSSRSMACVVSFGCVRDPMCCQITTLNPMTETTSAARLIQSPTVIFTGSSTVSLEKGRATFVLLLGDTTCGAERDLGAPAGLLPLAISQPPISQTGDVALPPAIIDGRHSAPTCCEPGTGWPRPVGIRTVHDCSDDGPCPLATVVTPPPCTATGSPMALGRLARCPQENCHTGLGAAADHKMLLRLSRVSCGYIVERVTRIELALSAWEVQRLRLARALTRRS